MGRPRSFFGSDECLSMLSADEMFGHVSRAALARFVRKNVLPELPPDKGEYAHYGELHHDAKRKFGLRCQDCGKGGGRWLDTDDGVRRICPGCYNFTGTRAWTVGLPMLIYSLKSEARKLG